MLFIYLSAVGWGTALQAGRSRVRFPMVSLEEFFIDIILLAALDPGVDSASNRNEYQEYFLVGQRRPVRRADNLTTFMCRLSWNLGAPNLLEPSGPVQACNGVAFLSLFIFEWVFIYHFHLVFILLYRIYELVNSHLNPLYVPIYISQTIRLVSYIKDNYRVRTA